MVKMSQLKCHTNVPSNENANMLVHFTDKLYQCEMCHKRFKTRHFLQIHMESVHSTEILQCGSCQKQFRSMRRLKIHEQRIHRASTCRVTCEICGKQLLNVETMKHHMMTQHTKPKRWKCTHCDEGYPLKRALESHLLRVHSISSYACAQCDYKCGTKENLSYHSITHLDKKQFVCKQCSRSFATRFYLKSHEQRIHQGVVRYRCDICGKVLSCSSTLQRHVFIHSGQKPVACSHCSMRFPAQENLRSHLKYKHSDIRQFSCHVCSFAFKSPAALRRHLIVQHGIGQWLECPDCDAKLVTKQAVQVHRLIHHDVDSRPFACSECPKRFVQRSELRCHMNVHLGIKPYGCSVCNSMFYHKHDLTLHIKRKH